MSGEAGSNGRGALIQRVAIIRPQPPLGRRAHQRCEDVLLVPSSNRASPQTLIKSLLLINLKMDAKGR
jgi:hypothetical protein